MVRRLGSIDQLPLFLPESDWRPPASLPDLRGKIEEMALDTETRDDSLAAGRGPGWAYRNSKICGVSAAWQGDGGIKSFYAPVRHPDTECLDPDVVWDWVRSHQAAGIRVICHNSNYDYGNLGNEGVGVPDLLDDTVAMTVMVDENRTSYKLDDVAAWLGIPGKDERLLREAASAYGFGNDVKGNLWRMPGRYVGPYAAHDAETTLRAAELLRPRLEAEGLVEAYRLEMDLVPLVLEMRRRGVRVNVEAAERARVDLLRRRDEALADLSHHLGHRVGWEEANSPRHLARWFDDAGIVPPRTAPTERFEDGQASFVGDWMEKNPHWLPQRITLIRQLEMAQSKFLKGFIIDYAHRGRLHANINSFRNEEGGTRSHRFSYSDPPLQQMYSRDSTPLKEKLAHEVRGCFEPEEEELWGSSDAKQQEYRIIVHYAELRKLSKASDAGDRYRNDPSTDYHDMVVDMTGLSRHRAKFANFAKSYGAGADKFAEMIDSTPDEARAIMAQYDRELPFVKELAQDCQRLADRRGFIRLIDGARCHFDFFEPAYRNWDEEKFWAKARPVNLDPELAGTAPCSLEVAQRRLAVPGHPWHGRLKRAFTHKAGNRLIQGSAARQIKLAMRACWREGHVPLLQMHDELCYSLSDPRVGETIAKMIRDAVKLTVPMLTDTEYGTTWGNARTIKNAQKQVLYGATWDEAVRLRQEGPWWKLVV